MNPLDQIAIMMEAQRAMNIDHSARCRCGEPRYLHQFGGAHEGGVCTRSGCGCRRFEKR